MVSFSELNTCAFNTAEHFDMTESTRESFYNLGMKYWTTIDFDSDGVLNHNEFTYIMATLATVDAKIAFLAFDNNNDNILDFTEMKNFDRFVIRAQNLKRQPKAYLCWPILLSEVYRPKEGYGHCYLDEEKLEEVWGNAQGSCNY